MILKSFQRFLQLGSKTIGGMLLVRGCGSIEKIFLELRVEQSNGLRVVLSGVVGFVIVGFYSL